MIRQLATSEWDWLYQHALGETDPSRVLAALHDAVKLMVARLHELGPESRAERQNILLCLDDMRVLQVARRRVDSRRFDRSPPSFKRTEASGSS